MKRGLLGLCAASSLAALPAIASAQVTWSENFDSYGTGTLVTCDLGVCAGPNNWTSWDSSEGAAGGLVTTAQASSAPNSLSTTNVDDMVAHFVAGTYDDGVHKLTTQVYISSAQTDNNYFIMLSNYDVCDPSGDCKNWAVQVEFDGSTGKVRDADGGAELDLLTDQWVTLEVIMNLNNDPTGDTATYLYNGVPLVSNQWTDGSPEATTTFQAIDIWGDNSTFTSYLDNMTIETLPELGACCVPDAEGSCNEDSSIADCNTVDGLFQGFGSVCAASDCAVLGANGWVVAAPLVWSDDSTRPIYQSFPCDGNYGFNSTVQWEVTIPWPETWKFSVCGTATWDSVLGVSTSPCGNENFNDDFDCGAGFVPQSEINVALAAGTYYVTLAGASGADAGDFTLTIDAPCALNSIPGALPENELACFDNQPPDVYNSGCNDPAEAFLPIACGQSYAATAGRFVIDTPTCPPGDVDGDGDIDFQDLLAVLAGWSPAPGSCPGCAADVDLDDDVDFQDLLLVLANWEPLGCPTEPASARDTDWWLFELTETTTITYTGTGTMPLQTLLITLPGADITEGCVNLDITAFTFPAICETGTITRELAPGRYALWGGPQGGTDPITAPCGSEYNITLTCTP